MFRIDICFCPVHASLASSIGYAAWQHIGSNSGPRDFAKYRGLKIFQLNSYAAQVCSTSFLITGAYEVKIAMLNILRLWRSIRKYREKKIEREIVDQLKEAALRSPTSRGINSWRFLFVDDKAMFGEALFGQRERFKLFERCAFRSCGLGGKKRSLTFGSKTAP